MDVATLYVTTAHRNEALQIANSLLNERLIACANLIDNVTSVYRWDKAIQESRETVLLLKTRCELIEQVTNRVKELHSYECPCVVAWKSVGGNPEFFNWIHSETDSLPADGSSSGREEAG